MSVRVGCLHIICSLTQEVVSISCILRDHDLISYPVYYFYTILNMGLFEFNCRSMYYFF